MDRLTVYSRAVCLRIAFRAREVAVRAPALVAFLVSVVGLASAPSIGAEPPPSPSADPAREAIVHALATGGDIPGQARNLVELAWPAGRRDEVVAARARRELERYGNYSINALRGAVNTVKISYTEEVVETTLQAQRESRVEMIREYLPILIDALWVGSHGANSGISMVEVTFEKKIVWTSENALAAGVHHFQILTTNGKTESGMPQK